MKADINRAIFGPCPAYWALYMLPLGGAKDKHFSFSQKSCQRGLIQRTGWLEFSRDDHLNPEFSVLQGPGYGRILTIL